jgi:hypothetical protein
MTMALIPGSRALARAIRRSIRSSRVGFYHPEALLSRASPRLGRGQHAAAGHAIRSASQPEDGR